MVMISREALSLALTCLGSYCKDRNLADEAWDLLAEAAGSKKSDAAIPFKMQRDAVESLFAIYSEDEMVGRMYRNESGQLDFEGDATASAHSFMDAIKPQISGEVHRLREQISDLHVLLRDAQASHGTILLTDPPQDPWKVKRISERISEALERKP